MYANPLGGSRFVALVMLFWIPSAAFPQTGRDTVLEEVVVTAHQRDYRLDSAKSALGFDLKLIETPAAISVITEDLLKDQQVNNVDDALRNVAGVNKFKTGNGGEEKFSIRGFDASQSIYKDGARINNPLNASNIPSTETANIDRIEILKGSSALLYGEGKPGGIINYITKRPEVERGASIEVLYGSDSFKKFEFDTTGSFGGADLFAYRLVGAYEDSESFRDELFRERLLLNPTIAFMPNEQTAIVVGYEYIDDEYTQDRGQVLDGNNVAGYSYSNRLDADQFFGIPGWNEDANAESERFYLVADYQVNDGWQLSANVSRTENDKENFDSSPFFIDFTTRAVVGAPGTPVADEVAIQPRKSIGDGETNRYKLQSIIEFADPVGFQHKLLASVSYEDFETTSTSFRSDRNVHFNVATGEYFTPDMSPVEGEAQEIRLGDDILFGLNNRGESSNQDYEEAGINVLDYIDFNEHWAWLIGGRYSEYEDDLNGFDDDDFSLRTGIVYSVNQDLSLYVSYAEGYTNSGGREDVDGKSIDPETSTSYELGAKWQLFDSRLLLTATVYRVENDDLAFVVNPEDPIGEQYFDNVGTIESDGVELEVVGFISDNWRIQGGYSYIDNEITDGGTGDGGAVFEEGNSLPGVADHNFNLFTFYEIPVGPGTVGAGGGIFYQDEVYISTENRGKYEDWTQVDLGVYYRQDAWKFQLNAKNVTDEDYRQAQGGTTSDSFAAVRVGTAAPRSYVASVAYEF